MTEPTDLRTLPNGQVLSDYRIEGVLGQGGFGITYLATDTNLGRKVAIKEYFPREFAARDSTLTIRATGNAEDRETFNWGLTRFLEEARILARFEHPNIVAVRRFFEANGTAYLVMDYCDGEPLDEIIKRDGPLSKERLDRILLPLLNGLEEIHSTNFLHRDIKPANIYIRRDGSPVLLDFGAARQETGNHSRSVTSLATAGYAAVEQYSTRGKQGPWTDIYGLGATLYRAVTGEKPQESTDRMLEDTLEPAADKGRGRYPVSLLAAIDAAMSVRPEQRPQSVAQWRQMIGVGAPALPPSKSGLASSVEEKTKVEEKTERTSSVNAAKTTDERSAVWNPDAAAGWSLIFTPAFGSYIQMLNWKTLSEPEKAASAKTWFYISIWVLLANLASSLVALFWEVNSRTADVVLGFAPLVCLYVWWISTGRWQGIYLREKFGARYSRKPWGKPLLLGIGAYIIFLALMFVIGFMFNEAPTSTSTVTTPASAPIPTPITNSQTSSGKSKDCDVCPEMVVIPAGSFSMGSPDTEAGRDADEGPMHQVNIAGSFSLGKFEITLGEFKQFVQSTGHPMTGGCVDWNGKEFALDAGKSWRNPGQEQTDKHPVTCVSWDDARAYVKWLSTVAKKTYRLPSEAEWEYAARAMTKTAYSFGNSSSELSGYTWFSSNSEGKTHFVGAKTANNFGLHDMHGNVFEWTEDCWNENYTNAPTDGSVWTAGNCSRRVVRGGSWGLNPRNLRSARRGGNPAASRGSDIGFRVARTD